MKINVTQTQKIEEIITEIEGKARSRLFDLTSIGEIIESAKLQLKKLDIPKKLWVGCTVNCYPAKVANSYRGYAEGTAIDIIKYPSGWFLTYVGRIQCGQCSYGQNAQSTLQLSPNAKKALKDTYNL